jgi:hypothetical protein
MRGHIAAQLAVKLKHTLKLSDAMASDYDAVFLAPEHFTQVLRKAAQMDDAKATEFLDRPDPFGLFRGFAIEVFVVGLRVGAGGMDDAVPVVRRSIERVKLQRNISAIDNIMIGAGRDDHRETGPNRGMHTVENRLARAFLHTEELIEFMDFHSDLLLGVQRHDDELAVLSCI